MDPFFGLQFCQKSDLIKIWVECQNILPLCTKSYYCIGLFRAARTDIVLDYPMDDNIGEVRATWWSEVSLRFVQSESIEVQTGGLKEFGHLSPYQL